jgi:RNA polymerase sigma factor (sigma-70 family)
MKDAIEQSSLSEMEIVTKIINGESALFSQLISKYNSLLYKIASQYGFNKDNAQDVLQDTHLAVYRGLSQFKFKSTFKTWLSKIMIRKCLYRLKYGYKKYEECYCLKDQTIMSRQICKEFENVENIFLKKELHDLLHTTVNQLPSLYKTVFILREEEGYSVAETANLLNISCVNVRVRLKRAKLMLQTKLKYLYCPGDNNLDRKNIQNIYKRL